MSFEFKPLIFDDYQDADRILTEMKSVIEDYGATSVADFYLSCRDNIHVHPKDHLYGWVNLENTHIVKDSEDGYFINFPKPIVLDEEPYESDMVNHPPHYQSETGLETIDIIAAVTFDLKGIEAVDTGNVVKYISRWKKKNGLQDLEKAKWYLEHLINHIKKLED